MSALEKPEIGSEFARQFIGARQGFHEFVVEERGKDPNIIDPSQEIVDINISGIHRPTEFDSFAEIEREYDRLRGSLPDDELDHDTLEQKIEADQMMLRVLQGDEVNFDTFLMTTMGFGPEQIPRDKIDTLLSTLDGQLRMLGVSYDEVGLETYKKKMLLTDPADIKRVFGLGLELSRRAVGRYVDPPQKQVKPEYVNDASILWSGYMTTDEQGEFRLKANIHPTKRYTAGKIKTWMLHEDGGHVVQMGQWEDAIRNGLMSPASGLTSMTSPETTQAEAVASFAETLLPEVVDTDEQKLLADIAVNYDTLFTAIMHNAHVGINSGQPEDYVVATAVADLPFEMPDRIRRDIQDGRDLPTYRAALACYGFVRELMRPVIDSTDLEKRRKTIEPIYKRALTVERIKSIVAASA